MAASPFKTGSTGAPTAGITKAGPTAGEDVPGTAADGLPAAMASPNRPASRPVDPLSDIGSPSGVSGFKTHFLLGQIILLEALNTGEMPTSVNPNSPFLRANITPLTVPQPGAAAMNVATLNDDGQVQVLTKDGDVDTDDAYGLGVPIEDMLIFNAPLIREGKKALSKRQKYIAGRLTKGAKKPGQSAPYILVELGDADADAYNAGLDAARAHLASLAKK